MNTNTILNSNYGGFRLGQYSLGLSGSYLNGYIQEVIIWPQDLLSTISGIETDVNSYYAIY